MYSIKINLFETYFCKKKYCLEKLSYKNDKKLITYS